MSSLPDQNNRILSRISVAAKTALMHPAHVDISNFIGAGPSIRARARLALIAAFLVAGPTLFIGVLRTEKVAEQAATLSDLEGYWKDILYARLTAQELDVSLMGYMFEGEFDNAQIVLTVLEKFTDSINRLSSRKRAIVELAPRGYFENHAHRLDNLIRGAIDNGASMAPARLSLIAIAQELARVEMGAAQVAMREKKRAAFLFSTVSRDQLVLFLILLFAMPIFVGFVPGWIVAPLRRLRQISNKIEMGKLKEMAVSGRDEVSALARTLKSHFLRKEDLEQKKSSKIFEIRNVLRAIINRVEEPVFVVDSALRINYTNEAAAKQLGLPVHQMEGRIISDCMYSPAAIKALEKSFEGDGDDEGMPLKIEPSDGREYLMQGKIGVVRNRDGEVSRAVLVLYKIGAVS